MECPLTIGALARATGVASKAIRYYEQVGVLPAPARSAAGYRQYTRHDVHRLLFIRRARALGPAAAAHQGAGGRAGARAVQRRAAPLTCAGVPALATAG
ncbi:MAG: hypothetical protein KatS3mg131_3936 [Candidatus Tectimicrobiota bacterium]|nr:MAG: hypothetical protein KatS3mg131_3936 [Candidatus Tectomicrobia bacterium]